MRSLIALVVAVMVGTCLAALTSVPPVILVNLCCGLGWVASGMVAALVYCRMAGGGGLLGSLLAGAGAGAMLFVSTLTSFCVLAATVSDGAAQALQQVELPAEPPTVPQLLDILEPLAQGDPKQQAQFAEMRQKWETASESEKERAQGFVETFYGHLLRMREGESTALYELAVLLALVLSLPVGAFVTFGGMLGGLMFVSDPDPEEMVETQIGTTAAGVR